MNVLSHWLFILGFGVILFAISLFVIRIPIRTILLFFTIGVPVIVMWMFLDKLNPKHYNQENYR